MGTIIKTIGSGVSRDFSTLAAWQASLPANLVTDGNSYVGQCYNDSEFVSASNLCTISGNTTDATHTISLTTGAGQGFRDNANAQTNALRYNASNGVGIRCTSGYADAIVNSVANVFVSNLQVKSTGSAFARTVYDTGAAVIDACIIESSCVSNGYCSLVGQGTKIRNSLMAQLASGADSIAWFGNANGSAYNCTFVAPSDVATKPTVGVRAFYGQLTLENCAVFGATTQTSTGAFGTFVPTTCMTDNAAPPTGFTGSKTYASQFQNTAGATRDFRLKSGADLIDAGTTDSTNAATDIVGTSRPQGPAYDIGAWEFVSAGGATGKLFTPSNFDGIGAGGPFFADRLAA